ncbi:hypothetical protein [Vallicoccus soli]|uniref:Uncharacterized protein n=1 Tax=Vallicoccus soli TaxID=2339232 RepID=A0A3A3YMX0_9ACTN|nr:hypothetical protein [Vallicoccus soli]RJK92448.1 hypothetical protein D5H78_18900 [Vallicoccus soli]
MYTLVSAPVLAFDLVRRPGGEHVARLLREALELGPADLPVLAACAPSDVDATAARAGAWLAVSAAEAQRLEVTGLLEDVRAATAEGRPVTAGTLQALESAPLGSLDALLRCVRREVLDWTWSAASGPLADGLAVQSAPATAATSVLCDAVASCYLAGELDDDARRRLAGPWTRAARALGLAERSATDPGEGTRALLARLRALGPADLERLRAASAATRASRSRWAEAVHDASWAVHLSGRVRPAAAAQLLAVEAVRDAGLPLADSAGGVWNLLSGAVQASVVADLLGDEPTALLASPVRAALGPLEPLG